MEDGDSHTNHPGTPTITVHNVPEAQTYTQTQTQSQTQTPSQQKENIPPQHQHQHQHQHLRTPPDDSSVIETTALDPDDKLVDSMTEDDEVRAHLSDVESSFVPPISPIQVAGPDAGIDDTYLFDAAANRPLPSSPSPSPAPSESASSFGPSSFRRQHDADTASVAGTKQTDTQVPAATFTPEPSPPTRALQPTVESAEPSHLEPRPGDSNLAAETGNSTSTNTSSLEQMSSSPTAAAAARTVSRAISMATSRSAGDETASEHADPDASSHLDSHFDASQDSSFSVDAPSLHDKGSGPNPNRLSVDAGNTPGQALKGGARPKYLRSRHASHNSSTESFAADDDVDSDVTVGMGADYALQSGGAAPAYDMTRSISNTLSRSVSMGSMASGIDEIPDPIRPDALEPLREVDNPMPGRHVDYSDATTPKPKRNSLMPTDTVIARHVRNVEVPESLAQEYKTKGGFTTPLQQQYRKVSEYTPAPPTGTTNRSGKNMTLKEQSNTIERLSKENFDLKLKVMFLSDRLDTLSEEGVKEMISENVELKTKLAVVQRDNKILRRRVKELEKRLRDEEDRPSTARSGYSSDGPETPAFDPDAQEREEELTYLRERVEEYVTEIERLRNENMSNHAEKRRLVETVKTMGDRAGERVGESLGRQEEADVFKDLLEQETARREQADDDNRKLRDEIFRLRQEMNGGIAVGGGAGGGGMHHTTNIYNITRKAKPQSPSRSRPVSGLSGEIDPATSLSQSSTLVEELRRESEQLRHENAELRREVGAQTSMLTSRNREKERLYQEIEDLKLAQRRGGPAPSTVDSLLDRSASRAGAHERSTSRGSGRTRLTMTVEDPDREELENKLAEHRDKINELKLEKQELQREMQTCMEELDASAEAKRRLEEENAALRDELENHVSDMMQLQTERDEALQDHSYIENEFDILRNEAQQEIDTLEAESDQKSEEIQRLLNELQDRSENFDALQEEMRQMSEALVRLEDDQVNKMRRIEQLESEIAEANKEGEELEAKLLESNDKAQRLGVQQESSQGEIAFLREEQEGDKIRIGDLEAALANCEQGLRDERDRTKELDQRLANERKQREIVADREKEEVQQIINELNREVSTAKDEARRLRKNLTSREIEATEWKERLMELESNLREALGDLNGTRSGILKVSYSSRCGICIIQLILRRSRLPNSSRSSRILFASSTFQRAPCLRRTVSSSSVTPSSNHTALNLGGLPRCLTRNAKPTATPRTSLRRSSARITTSHGPSRVKIPVYLNWRRAAPRTRRR
ncbi:hypothetical protein F5B20DRAFT_499356 [Whalleya microplaca]|nr:hypothetical protein F5B20DRAFT_499356 [Whalleya microplaca]